MRDLSENETESGKHGGTWLVSLSVHLYGSPFLNGCKPERSRGPGIPFDCGTHPVRIGARYGSNAIREQSSLARPWQPPPLLWRGDGAVTLPQLRALHAHYPDLVVLHIDAHTDTFPGDGDAPHHRYNTATTFTRTAEEGVIDTENSIHVGPRGTLSQPEVFEHTRKHGYELIDGHELYSRGFKDVAAHIHDRMNGWPVYLCFDMDFFDPSCAPGVCTPTWGGGGAREGLSLLQDLAGLNLVAVDVNTVTRHTIQAE